MFRKELALIAIVCTIWACNLQAEQIHSTWVGGATGDWETATNWSPAIVPENGVDTFAVTINGGSGADIDRGHVYTIDSLSTYGNVTFGYDDKDIYILTCLSNHGFLKPKKLNVWQGDIVNSGTLFLGPTFEAWTESEFRNTGFVEMYDAALSSESTFVNENPGSIKGDGAIHSEESINNAGVIRAFGGCLLLHSSGNMVNTGTLVNSPGTSLTVIVSTDNINNQGIVTINNDGAIVFDCNNLNNEPNAIVTLLGGTLAATTITQKQGATLQGFGGITGDVVIDPDGIIKLTGPTNVIGDVEIKNNATLQISDGLTLITGQTVNNGTIRLIGGTVIFQGGYSGSGNITHEAGTYRNHFDINSDGIEDFKDFAEFANNWLWQATWY
jgi:hypothetical protein